MNVLITGVLGMVGSHMVDFLLEKSEVKIYGFCRWNESMDNIEHLTEIINNTERVKLIYGDLNDFSSIVNAIDISKPDYVFHLGAQSYPQTSFDSPIETLQTNIIGTANLLEALRKSPYKDAMIHVCASSEIFGRVSKDKLPINEECSLHPASPYAISKVGTDLIGRYYGEAYKMNVMTTRMFTHTGPRRGDVFHESTFAKQIAMIEYGLQEPKIFAGNCKVEDTLKYLISKSFMRNEIEIVVDPNRLRPIDADLQIPDTTKFKELTGWEPKIPFNKTMDDLLDYWRDRINNGRKFLNR